VKGVLFNIQRYAIHDGPGIRTTAFFKGCPLSCGWCHNPEGRSVDSEIMYLADRCMNCGACEEVCPNPPPVGLRGAEDSHRSECAACGSCAEVCPTGARRLVGFSMTVGDLIDEVERDRPFYEETGGGVTFSGGEPLMQGHFLMECLKECRRRGLHTSVDTCGFAERGLVLRVSELTDLFLYDLKILDPLRHKEVTGVPLEPVLQNLRAIDESDAAALIRFPLIPGVTDGRGNLEALGDLVGSLKNTRLVHILPFHKTASDKYTRLRRQWGYDGLEPAPQAVVEDAIGLLESYGVTATAGGWIYDRESKALKKTESGS